MATRTPLTYLVPVDISEKCALAGAISRIDDALGLSRSPEEAIAFCRGLLLPEKMSPISAYLAGGESYLLQEPAVAHLFQYDIFETARTILILRAVANALETLGNALPESLRTRFVEAKSTASLDDVVFEIVVAAAYERNFGPGSVTFIDPTPTSKTPEFRVDSNGRPPIFVECKRAARYNSYAQRLQEHVDSKFRVVLDELRSHRLPRAVEVRFRSNPEDIEAQELADAVLASVASGESVERPDYSIVARHLGDEDFGFLYPSPKYYANRFGYRPSEWHGFVAEVEGPKLGPSFYDSATWDSAAMWRVDDENVLRKGLKLNFKLIFDGLEQLRDAGRRTVLHLWLERANGWGHRKDLLRKIYKTLEAPRPKKTGRSHPLDHEGPDYDLFSYLVFNETVCDVTVGGRFDCSEHCHSIGGFIRWQEKPPITNVFVAAEDMQSGTGEWGVGIELPPLDEVEESKRRQKPPSS